MLPFLFKKGPSFSLLSLCATLRLVPCHCAAVASFVSSRSSKTKFQLPPTMVHTRRGACTPMSPVAKGSKKAVSKAAVTTPQKSTLANKKSNKSPAKSPKPPPPVSKMIGERRLLFSLRHDDELLEATLVCRPSKRNKSPYVGDIRFSEDDKPPYPLVHLPNLDMGGKCRAGVRLLVKPSRDRKGVKIPSDATGKYGTPKCQYSCQLS